MSMLRACSKKGMIFTRCEKTDAEHQYKYRRQESQQQSRHGPIKADSSKVDSISQPESATSGGPSLQRSSYNSTQGRMFRIGWLEFENLQGGFHPAYISQRTLLQHRSSLSELQCCSLHARILEVHVPMHRDSARNMHQLRCSQSLNSCCELSFRL